MVAIFTFDAIYYLRKTYKKQAVSRYLWPAVFVAIGIVFSVVLHEFSHAMVASAFGIKIVGAGISWWGAYVEPRTDITVLPVPELFISLAGPLANAILGGLAAYVVFCRKESLFENTVQYFALINLQLAILNMLPIGGLDGAKVLEGFNAIVFDGSRVSWWIFAILFYLVLFYAFGAVRDWLKDL